MAALLPDFTLLIQLGLFLASWLVLHVFVFRPYLALQHHRHEKTAGLREKALADRERATKLQSDYESFMKVERKKVSAWTDDERQKISEQERQIVQTARAQVGEELQALRARVQAEFDKARHELLPQVREYSSQIASRLVGYKVSVPISSAEVKKSADAESTVVS